MKVYNDVGVTRHFSGTMSGKEMSVAILKQQLTELSNRMRHSEQNKKVSEADTSRMDSFQEALILL